MEYNILLSYAALFFFDTALQLIGNTCVCARYQTYFSLKNPND